MSLSSDNVGYLDISNAILRVGTLDVVGLQGVDTVTNVLRANSVLVYDDMGTDIVTPPFTLGAGVSRSTSPTEIELRYASGNNFMYKGIKLPNFFVGEFEVYSADASTGNVFVQMYTESTTSYGNDGYELVFDWQYNTITLKYDGTQIAQGTSAGLSLTTWQRISVTYDRNVWTVSVNGYVKFLLDDSERAAVYENPTTGQYLRFATNSVTSRKLRAIKFMNGSYWSQSKLGHLSYTNGNVGIGTYAPTTHRFEVFGSTKMLNVDATTMAISGTTEATSRYTGALTVAGGLGVAKTVYSRNLITEGLQSVRPPTGSSTDAPYQFTLSEFNNDGNDRWWRIGRLFTDGSAYWSFFKASVSIQRVNSHERTIDFHTWGNATSPDDFYLSYANVWGQSTAPYAGRVIMYRDTTNHYLDIYVFVATYARVTIRGATSDTSALTDFGGSDLGLNATPNWSTTAPTTSGTYTVFYDSDENQTHGGAKSFLVQKDRKLGINIDGPDEALHVGGNIRLGGRAGNDDNADYSIRTAGQLAIRANDTSDTDGAYVSFNLISGPTSNTSNTSAIQLGSFSDCTVRTFCKNYKVTQTDVTAGGQFMVYSNSGISSNVCVQGDGNIERTYTYQSVRYAGGMHLTGSSILPLYDGAVDTAFRMDLGTTTYRWRDIYARGFNFYSDTLIGATETMGVIGRHVSTPTGSNGAFLTFAQVYEDSSQVGWHGWSQKIASVVDSTTHGGIRFNGYNNHYGLSFETGASGGASPNNLKTVIHIDQNGSVGIGTDDPFNYDYAPYSDFTLGGLHVRKDIYTQGNGYWCPNHTIQSTHQFYGKMYYYAGGYAEGPFITSGMMIQNLSTSDIGSVGNYSQRVIFKTHDWGTYGGTFEDCAMGLSTNGKVTMRKYNYATPLSKLHVEDNGYAFTVSGTRDTADTYTYMRLGHSWNVGYADYCSVFESYNNWGADFKSSFKIYTHTGLSEGNGGYNITGIHIRDGLVGLGGDVNTNHTCTVGSGNGSVYAYSYIVRGTYGTNSWSEGTGDDASYTTYNSVFKVWFGMAWKGYDDTVRHVLNGRTGDFSMVGTCTAAAFSTESDDRVKDFERPLRLGTETLLKLNPEHYYKRDKLELTTKVKYREEFGLIAQEVYYDAPELRHLVKLHYDADPSSEKPVRDENVQIDPPYADWGSQAATLDVVQLVPVIINSIKEIVTEKDAVKTRVTDVAFSNVLDHRGLIVCARTDEFSPKSGKPLVELSSRVACKAWYGVIAGANVHTEDSETLIARGGDAKVWVLTREGASVESGDLLCTSNVHGYAWTQSDDLVRSSTVAKLTQGCDFTVPVTRPKKKIRRELRDVTYYIKRRWYPSTKAEYDTMPDHKRDTYLEDYYVKTEYEYRPKADIKKSDDEEWNVVVFIKQLTYEISKETYDALSPEAREAYKAMEGDKFVRVEQQTATQEAYDLMTEEERAEYKEYQAKPTTTDKTVDEWAALEDAVEKAKYVLKIRRVYKRMEEWVSKDPLITNTTVETKEEMVDVLDADGQRVYDDDPDETELPYEIRYLSAQGTITTRHNAVFYAALLNCTLMG